MGTKLPVTAAGGGEGNPGFSQVHAACATLRAADAGPGAGAGPASAGEQWREHISQLALCQPGPLALVKLHPPWNQNAWEVLSFSCEQNVKNVFL